MLTTNRIPEREANPVVIALFAAMGGLWWLPKAAIAAAVLTLAPFAGRRVLGPLLAATAAYALVVADNALNIILLAP